MKISMKTFGVAAAAVVAGMIGWQALAETPNAPGGQSGSPMMMMDGSQGMGSGPMMMMHGSQGMGMGRAHMGAAVADPAAQLADVKRELAITPEQEPAWETYSKAFLGTIGSLKAQHESQMAAMHDGTMGDHVAVMATMHAQHQQAFDTVKGAAQALLGALDESQQAKAREILPGLAPFHPGMMGQHAATGGKATVEPK
jgi:hypothetical protein